MTQSISNAYRIAAAESAIERHNRCFNIHPEGCCTEQDAIELLQSLALWAEVNGICLRLQKAVYAEAGGDA
jgi:hypothetical protein